MGICLIVEWFTMQMPGTMVVWCSDHHLVNELVFRRPFEYQSAIQMPGTIKVRYSDVSAIHIPTVYPINLTMGKTEESIFSLSLNAIAILVWYLSSTISGKQAMISCCTMIELASKISRIFETRFS